MNHPFLAVLSGIAVLMCAACIPASSPATTAPIVVPATPTPTPTPTPIILAADTPTPTISPTPRPTRGEIEVRFSDPDTEGECEAHFPFTINWGEARTTIDGGGVLSCAFTAQHCGDGVCMTYHRIHDMDASLAGELLASSARYPHSFLNTTLAGEYSMTQYWTDVPPDAFVPFTEANPAVFKGSDIVHLLFDFVEGATEELERGTGGQTFTWKFTLHLD